MKQKYFVVGDIHGSYEELIKMLEHWDEENEQLVFIGDYIDRGPDSKGVLVLVRHLVNEKGAIALKGNHESMLFEWLEKPIMHAPYYLGQGGYQTMMSFGYHGYDADFLATKLVSENLALVSFMKTLPLYHETDSFIFVHAGVNLMLDDWEDSNQADYLWIRESFHHALNRTGKTIVFGHTPTRFLNPDQTNKVWRNNDATKIGIDGGICYVGGCLHGIHLTEGSSDFSISTVLKVQ